MSSHALHIPNGLSLDFVPADGGTYEFLVRDTTTGEVGKVTNVPASRVGGAGDVSEVTSSVLTITGGTGAVLNSGLSIQVKQATSGQSGYLSSTDWSTFNNKLGSSLNSAQILVGNVSNVATAVDVTGDIAISNTGVVSITGNSIVDADINSGAAIQFSKMETLTVSRALVSNGAGRVSVSSTTATQIGYLNTVTSSIQSQIDSKLSVTLSAPTSGQIISYNGSAWVNSNTTALPAGGSTHQVLRKIDGTNFNTEWHTLVVADLTDLSATVSELNLLSGVTTTSAQFNYLNTTTSDVQTQIDNKLNKALAYNAVWVGNGSGVAAQVSPGNNGDVFTIVSGSPQWQPPTPPGNVSGPGSSTDNALVRWNGSAGDAIQNSGIIIDDSDNVTMPTGTAIRTSTSAGNTLLFRAYDVDGASYTTFATLTANNTPTFDLATSVTIGGAAIYRVGGTDVSLADGGTGASLSDPGANRLWGWDDTDNAITFITIGTNLSYDHATHTLSASGGGGGGGDVSGPGSATDNALARFDTTTGKLIQNSVGILSDTGDLSGIANLTINTTGAIRTATSAGNTLLIQAYDVDGASYTTFATLTANNTPTMDLNTTVTIGTAYIYRVGGTDVSLADGGTGASLSDPNADRIFFWDDSAGSTAFLATGTSLTINATTIEVSTNGIDDTMIRQSAGLSVIGRSANSTGNVADITASTAGSILRLSGTSIGFGSIDLSLAGAVGSSILPIANGGTGSATYPGYLLASGGTLTGANTITGTTSNTVKYVFNSLGTTQTDGAGLWLSNTTAASAGAQQISPSLVFEGQGWKTDATAASQSVKIEHHVLPVQGTAASGYSYKVRQSINGGAYADFLSIDQTGSGSSPSSWTLTSGTFNFVNGANTVTIRNNAGNLAIKGGISSSTNLLTFGAASANTTNNTNYFNFTDTLFNSVNSVITRTNTGVLFDYVMNMSGSGVGGTLTHTGISFTPSFTMSGSTLNLIGFNYNPSITATIASHYAMLIQSGNVGIATATPAEKLHVVGNTLLNGNVSIGVNSVADYKSMTSGLFVGNVGTPPTAAIASGATVWAANSILKTWNDIAVVDSAKGIILKDTQGTPHYWRVTISTLGVLTTTDLGTSI